MKRIILPVLFVTLLGGCMAMKGKPRVVILQNPETMEFKNCEVSKYGLDQHYRDNDRCVEELINEGYVVWGTR